MDNARVTNLATLVVLLTGGLWGFYWIPVRQIGDLGLTGAWGSMAIVAAAVLVLIPVAWRRRQVLAKADRIGLASIALGGFAFFLYSVGLLYGRVAIIVILFFLTPVWSTLIGRYLIGWPITRVRVLVLILGILGLGVMLGADGTIPVPRSLGEWLGLVSGFLWAVGSIGIRVKADTGPAESAFIFAAGALLGGLILAPTLAPLPGPVAAPWATFAWVMVAGGFWWAVSMAGLMWATTKLEPARVGILLMVEVLIASLSAAVIIGETLSAAEMIGGALVLLAGILEVWPTPRGTTSQ